jgi:protocatechuate 3,4-dioxygenase beta subunit
MPRSNPKTLCLMGVVIFLLFPSTCRAQQSAGNTKPSEKPNGAITGRVIDSAGAPLLGAAVYVGRLNIGAGSQSTAVDNNGDFKVDGLEAGLYRVFANVPGYIPAPQSTPTDAPGYFHIGDSVTLTMIKGAVITGTVTGPSGAAVAVGVRAIRVRDDEGKAVPAPIQNRERLTDDRGVYRLYGLPPGVYIISAGGPPRSGFGIFTPSAYATTRPSIFRHRHETRRRKSWCALAKR